MYISTLAIKNFRGLADTTVYLHPSLTVLVGTNNAGKSSVLDALYCILAHQITPSRVSPADFRATTPHADIRTAPPVAIVIRIEPSVGNAFVPGELGRFVPSVHASGAEWISFKLTCSWSNDPAIRGLHPVLIRVDEHDQQIGDPFTTFPLQSLRLRRFGTVREFDRGTAGATTDWAQLFADMDPGSENLLRVARRVATAGRRFIDTAPDLQRLAADFRGSAELAGLGPGSQLGFNISSLEPEDILRGLELELTVPNSSRGFAPSRHGLGTQGVLLFRAYELYLQRILQARQPGQLSPVLTVEEPEAHLHPTAQRAIIERLADLPGQAIVTTHSPDIVRRLDTTNLRLLRSTPQGVTCRAPSGDNRPLYTHAAACFGRCILLVEGIGERTTVDIFAAHLGIDLGGRGIEIIDAGGQDNIPGLWEAFGRPGLGIPVVVIADADQLNPLLAFLNRARSYGLIATMPTGAAAVRQALRTLNYYVPPWGENLECALARVDATVVDTYFVASGQQDHTTWLSGQLQARRTPWGLRAPRSLNAVRSRSCRIAADKYEYPRGIARLLCDTHAAPAAVPAYIREALRAAEAASRGSL